MSVFPVTSMSVKGRVPLVAVNERIEFPTAVSTSRTELRSPGDFGVSD